MRAVENFAHQARELRGAVPHQQVAPGLGAHALEGLRRGHHRAGERHRLQHLVLDAAREPERRHRNRGVRDVGPHVGHAPGDFDARQRGERANVGGADWRRR